MSIIILKPIANKIFKCNVYNYIALVSSQQPINLDYTYINIIPQMPNNCLNLTHLTLDVSLNNKQLYIDPVIQDHCCERPPDCSVISEQ